MDLNIFLRVYDYATVTVTDLKLNSLADEAALFKGVGMPPAGRDEEMPAMILDTSALTVF